MPGLLGTSLNTDDILETLRGIGRGLNFGGTSGMIGAPVDMATAVLNNPGLLHPGLLGVQGLGIKDPVGGSKWIEQKLQNQGLLPQRQGNWQEGVGELASTFVNPMTAAAVAGPKLYAAEQRAIENAMAPTTLNKQAGAIVWHGSPHKFDKFDSKKIGTGEGAQAYGHGLYLAESPKVAQDYAVTLSAKQGNVGGTLNGKPIYDAYKALENQVNRMPPVQAGAGYNKLDLLERLGMNELPENVLKYAKESFGATSPEVAWFTKDVLPKYQGAGSLYKVDLPDTAIAKMLDWDKPLSQQSDYVKRALEPLGYAADKKQIAAFDDLLAASLEGNYSGPLPAMPKNPTGADIARGGGLFDAPSQVAKAAALQRAGIPGIRYLDGGSRGAGSGTSNFVVFPGNEDLLRILERNGQPIGLLGM